MTWVVPSRPLPPIVHHLVSHQHFSLQWSLSLIVYSVTVSLLDFCFWDWSSLASLIPNPAIYTEPSTHCPASSNFLSFYLWWQHCAHPVKHSISGYFVSAKHTIISKRTNTCGNRITGSRKHQFIVSINQSIIQFVRKHIQKLNITVASYWQ